MHRTMFDYNAFINNIIELVTLRMGDEYTAKVEKIIKNNSLEMDSLILIKKDKNYAPNIYLNHYYTAYVDGASMDELAEQICTISKNATLPISDDFSYSFDKMKSTIICRLVSYSKNKKRLEKIPHSRFLDLAITYHCLMQDGEDGIATIQITNEHMNIWDVTLDEIHALALKNTQEKFPPVIRSIDEVIRSMFGGDFPEDSLDFPPFSFNQPGGRQMYVLSNAKGINGAVCLLYDDLLKDFAERVQADVFILPSSIHEVILMPYDSTLSKEYLTEMVEGVNCTQVAADEVLSDEAYFYSREEGTLK